MGRPSAMVMQPWILVGLVYMCLSRVSGLMTDCCQTGMAQWVCLGLETGRKVQSMGIQGFRKDRQVPPKKAEARLTVKENVSKV